MNHRPGRETLHDPRGRGEVSRRNFGLGVAFIVAAAGAAVSGCGATWRVKQKLGPIEAPRMVSIMVFKSGFVRANDTEGVTDAVVRALTLELQKRHIPYDVSELAGEPRLPRLELAFWHLDGAPVSITVDCAFVSGTDEVMLVGRIDGTVGADNRTAAQNIAKAIVDELTGG